MAVAAVGQAGCRESGWRTVWVRLAAVGQADVLGMRMPAGSLEKRSKRVRICRTPFPKVSYAQQRNQIFERVFVADEGATKTLRTLHGRGTLARALPRFLLTIRSEKGAAAPIGASWYLCLKK